MKLSLLVAPETVAATFSSDCCVTRHRKLGYVVLLICIIHKKNLVGAHIEPFSQAKN